MTVDRGPRIGDRVFGAVVIGAGPCGLAAAISLKKAGYSVRVYERDCVVSSILQYPTYATFFSTAEKISLGGMPFVVPVAKPSRRDALAYYRAVVSHFGLDVRQYQAVESISRAFTVRARRLGEEPHEVRANAIVVATGYWGSPNLLGVPGEDLPHVSHSYREGHHAYQQTVAVVGGGNSAAEAALELWRSGARVTLVHFGPTFDKKIKPWILPDVENRIAEGSIKVRWNCRVTAIEHRVVHARGALGDEHEIPADHVYLLTGYSPNVDLLRASGVAINRETGVPQHNPLTLETPVPNLFVAGVVVAGFDANKVFIENGRYHGDRIVARLKGLPPPEIPGVSRDLDM
jgi:thioredoxin reductase (NADPH)